jgi:hypothetical protein
MLPSAGARGGSGKHRGRSLYRETGRSGQPVPVTTEPEEPPMPFSLKTALATALIATATQAGADPHPYVGMWVTADGHVRHQLLPNGRYDEARGSRESAYRGRYTITGSHIDYVDDTGFTADGDFVSQDVLHHGGMVLRRVR